jgi:Na+/proline symporter
MLHEKALKDQSLPEALGKLYGKYVQLIAGLSCVVLSIGYIAIQFKVIAKVL